MDSVATEDQGARRHTDAAGDQHVLDAFGLVAGRAADQACAFGDVVDAVDVRFRQQAAVGIVGKATALAQVARRDEILGFAALAEPEGLELHDHLRREGVVETGGIDVVGAETGHVVDAACRQLHFRQAIQFLAVEAGHLLLAAGRGLGDAANDRGLVLQVARALGAGDQQRHGAVGLLAAVVDAQPLGDALGVHVLLERQRLAVARRGRVVQREVALRDGHLGQVLGGHTEPVHVGVGDHRHPGCRRHHAVGHVPGPVDQVAADDVAGNTLAHALAGAAVHRAPDHDVLRRAAGNGHRGLLDQADRGTAAVVDLGVHGEIAQADRAGHFDLVVALQRVGDQAVDLDGGEARVVQAVADRLARQRQLRHAGVLAEFRHAYAGDRRFVLHADRHDHFPPWVAGRNIGILKPSSSSWMNAVTAMPKSTASGSQSFSSAVIRVPSSRSTSTMISGYS